MHLTTLLYTLASAALFSLQPAVAPVAAALPRPLAQKMCPKQAFGGILRSDYSRSLDPPPLHLQHNPIPSFSRLFVRSSFFGLSEDWFATLHGPVLPGLRLCDV